MKRFLPILLTSLVLLAGCQQFESNADAEILMKGISEVTNTASYDLSRALTLDTAGSLSEGFQHEITIENMDGVEVSGSIKGEPVKSILNENKKGFKFKSTVNFKFKNYKKSISYDGESYSIELNGTLRVTAESSFEIDATDLSSIFTDTKATNSLSIRNYGILTYTQTGADGEIDYKTPLSLKILSEIEAALDGGASFSNAFTGSINGQEITSDTDISISLPYHKN